MSHASCAPLRVVTFNIRFGTADDGPNSWPFRREAAISAISEMRPHVLCLQEALHPQLEELDEALPGYGRIGVGRDDGLSAGEHMEILYDREHVELAEHGEFWFSDTPEAAGSSTWGNENVRMCTFGRFVDRASGRAFWLYNLHIDHASSFSRMKSIGLLLQRIEPGPAVVCGDFNVGESDEVIRAMVAAGFRDSFREVNPDAAEPATYHDFSGVTEGDKIDYIFVRGGISTASAEVWRESYGGKWPSDHFPVVADLRFE